MYFSHGWRRHRCRLSVGDFASRRAIRWTRCWRRRAAIRRSRGTEHPQVVRWPHGPLLLNRPRPPPTWEHCRSATIRREEDEQARTGATCAETTLAPDLHTRSTVVSNNDYYYTSGAEWSACWTQAPKGPGSNRNSDAVGQQSWANCSHPSCLCSPSSKTGSSPLKGCRGNCRPAESNGILPPGLWLKPPAGWLPRTGISSGTLRSVIEYGPPLLYFFTTPV